MKRKDELKSEHLPVISIEQLADILVDFIFWYDKPYCKNINGANEIVGEYMTEEILNKQD